MRYLIEIDKQILKWFYQRRFNHIRILKTLIFIGDGPFWMIVVFISALSGQLLGKAPMHRLSVHLMAGLALSNMMFVPMKTYIKRKRPYADPELRRYLGLEIQNRDPGHGSKELESFPSGHVLWTTLCVSIICFQFGYPAVILSGWLIPAMMWLRLHLGVHYPSDVLAGLFLGGFNAAIVITTTSDLTVFITGLQNHTGYIYGYWIFICMFLIVGFKSWLKRV